MPDLREAARAYAEAVWRDDVLGTDETASDRADKLQRLEDVLDHEFPMPDCMERHDA